MTEETEKQGYIIRGKYGLISIDEDGKWWYSTENLASQVSILYDRKEISKILEQIRQWCKSNHLKPPYCRIIPVQVKQ